MRARTTFAGHAAHPLMVTVPIGLSVGAVAFDALSTLRPREATWSRGAFALLGLGVTTGVASASVGFVDWLAIPPGTRARRVGLLHLAANASALALMGASLAVRTLRRDRRSMAGVALAGAGIVAIGLGGWLGGELVERLGMSIDPGANPDAPSSLERERILVRLPPPRNAMTEVPPEPAAGDSGKV